MMESERDPFERLAGGPRTGPGPGCPTTDDLAAVAAGLAAAAERDSILDHASHCDSCGAMLRALIEDFTEEADPQMLQGLRTSRPEWQRDMAARMAKASRPKPVVAIRTWLARAAAVIVVAGGGWFAWTTWIHHEDVAVRSEKPPNPERLLAEAYTRQRRFEYRFPGAAHADVATLERGGSSTLREPKALDDAKSQIKAALDRNPEDAKSLELLARAEMFERNPEDAIELLKPLERKPDDPELLADLGTAFALRALLRPDDRNVDNASAMDYLKRAQLANPLSQETVFNLALVFEQMNDVGNAIKAWGDYLTLDPSGPWHDEAQHHLTDLELKKKSASKP